MRCLACDRELTDFEATRKYHGTKVFVDLCNHCVDPNRVYDETPSLIGDKDFIDEDTEIAYGEEEEV